MSRKSENIHMNLMLEILKKIHNSTEQTQNDISDIKFRLSQIEERQAYHTGRMDRIDNRLHQIEKQLDLVRV